MKKKYILKKNYDIETLFKKKRKINKDFVIYYTDNDEVKICFSVGKKIGNAVVRNKKRRQMKDIVSHSLDSLPPKKYLIIYREGANNKSFAELKSSLQNLLRKV